MPRCGRPTCSDFGLLQFPLVVGGVVPIFNIDGVRSGELRLTGALLADIFSGKLTRWNDPRIAELNPALRLPAASIIVAHRVDGSGTTFNWTNYLSKASADWRAGVGEGLSVRWPVGVGGKGNDGVAAFVKQTKNAIGYVDFANARRSQLAYALVQNKAGKYVVPGAKGFEAAAANTDWAQCAGFPRRHHGLEQRRRLPYRSDVVCLDVRDPSRCITDESRRGVLSLVTAARPGPGDCPGLRPASAGRGVPHRGVLAYAVCRRSVMSRAKAVPDKTSRPA